MESDRMGYLLPALTDDKFINQRDVVLNERRQNYENRPVRPGRHGAGRGDVSARSPVSLARRSGSADDLRAASLELTSQTFFETYYHPGNASLTLAGDIETERALDLAEQLLRRACRAGRVPPPVTAGIADQRGTVVLLEDRVELPRLYLSWHSPAMFAADDAELDIVRRRAGARQDVAPVQDGWSTNGAWRPTSRPISTRARCRRHVPGVPAPPRRA